MNTHLAQGATGATRLRIRPFIPLIFACLAALFTLGCSVDEPRIRFPEGSGGVNQPEHLDAPYLVLVSLDGFRADYMDRYPTPNLHRIADRGVRAEALIPAFPVKTFPNHYTIATGLHPDAHGIVGNTFYDAELDAWYRLGDREAVENPAFYRGEPIWVTAETQGMVASSYFFVGSEAPVMGVQPTEWHRFDAEVRYEDRVARVLEWLAAPAENRPHMITLYFEETDNVGHSFPGDSPEVEAAVARVDELIGTLLDGIEALPHGDEVHVVVVSDHGMMPFFADSTYVVPELVEEREGVTWATAGSYARAYVDTAQVELEAFAAELAAAMPRASVYTLATLPEHLHHSRGGQRGGNLFIIPDDRWAISTRPRGMRPPYDGFNHGWDRLSPDMAALFVAAGPRIRPDGMIEPLENIHIYPLLAEILELDPNPEIDGELDAVRHILR
jgi:predicted AlkP superfamily pyrophosphatase or phosphodiesterase